MAGYSQSSRAARRFLGLLSFGLAAGGAWACNNANLSGSDRVKATQPKQEFLKNKAFQSSDQTAAKTASPANSTDGKTKGTQGLPNTVDQNAGHPSSPPPASPSPQTDGANNGTPGCRAMAELQINSVLEPTVTAGPWTLGMRNIWWSELPGAEKYNLQNIGTGSWMFGDAFRETFSSEFAYYVILVGNAAKWRLTVQANVGAPGTAGAMKTLPGTPKDLAAAGYAVPASRWSDPNATALFGGQTTYLIPVKDFLTKNGWCDEACVFDPANHINGAITFTAAALDAAGGEASTKCSLDMHLESPLLIDLDDTGIELVAPKPGVPFDITANGQPQRISWPKNGHGVFLVLDKNHDGEINSGDELFGNQSVGPDGQKSANGFAALAKYDDNHDGLIDSKDAVFSQLRLWADRDMNGHAGPSELATLSDRGVAAIDLDYVGMSETDQYGNRSQQRSVVQLTSGEQRMIFDVWFKLD